MSRKILFINQEITPYVPETELSVMGRDLPQKTQEAHYEIRTFMPKWGNINERRGQLHEVIRLSGMNLIIDDTDHPLIIKVASIPSTRIQVYFIDNDDYFMKRQMVTDENGVEYDDNGQRAIFFARGVLETVKKLRWTPDLIHCQGWMAGIVPLYIKKAYNDEPCFANTKVVTSLFEPNISNNLGENVKQNIVFKGVNNKLLETYNDNFGLEDLHRLAIDYSDGIIEVGTGVQPELISYAQTVNKPVLTGVGEDYMAAYSNFYEHILGE